MRIPTRLLPRRMVLTAYLQIALLVVVAVGSAFGVLPEFLGQDPTFPLVALAVAPFPIQPELTAIAIAYKNPRLIADGVFPRLPVGSSEFKYLKHTLAEGFTLPDTKVGRKSKPNEVEFSATEVTNKTEDYGLDDPVPQADVDNAAKAGYDPIGRAVEGVTDLVLLDREKRASDLAFDAAQYAANNKVTLAGTSQWNDFVNSNPISDILTGIDAMVMRPNVAVLGRAVWTKLRQHPKIVKATYGDNTDAGVARLRDVAELLELDELLIGESFYNTAKKGQTVSLSRVWGKKFLLIARDPLATSDGKRVTYGFTAQFGSRVAGSQPDPNIGLKGGQRVRAGEQVKEVITANDLAYLITDAIA